MDLTWHSDRPARWDAAKRQIIGTAPAGIFDARFVRLEEGAALPGEWWRAESDGRTVAFGWLDAVWGDAEITVAVDAEGRREGVGTYVLDHLEREARERGLNYLYNTVRPSHPDREAVSEWFAKRGFNASEDGSLMRAVATRG